MDEQQHSGPTALGRLRQGRFTVRITATDAAERDEGDGIDQAHDPLGLNGCRNALRRCGASHVGAGNDQRPRRGGRGR
jgi:hypothetical protein